MKLNTKKDTANDRTHLFIRKCKEKHSEIADEKKMSKAIEKKIDNYDKQTLMRIQLIMEIYVYRQK